MYKTIIEKELIGGQHVKCITETRKSVPCPRSAEPFQAGATATVGRREGSGNLICADPAPIALQGAV